MKTDDQEKLELWRKTDQTDLGAKLSRDEETNFASVELPKPHLFIRRIAPTPSPVFSTYWQFAKSRQDAFFARFKKDGDRNYSHNPIIQRFRFTNVFRASDRVSQHLIRKVLYDQNWSPRDMVFRTLIFKFFNKIETWEALKAITGEICWEAYDFNRFDSCLSGLMSRKEKIYSAAYIMPSGKSVYGHKRKHRNHLKIIEAMINDSVPDRLVQQPSLEAVYQVLRRYPCIGPFIGYQLTIDMNYSRLINFSENDFVEPGPGALDGIAKCFTDLGDFSPRDIISYMVDVQEEAFERFAPGFKNLWGRPLHLVDCQNIFCEVGKYARVAHPEISGLSKRKRIKQIFRPAARNLEFPWYPPKWAINEVVSL